MPAQLDRALLAARPSKALERLFAWALVEGRPLTTRGRWLNPLVLALARAAVHAPLGARSERPIFVLGTGRSGTTWVARTLGLHPELSFLNEPKALWHVVRPDQDVLGSYARAPGRLVLGAADATPELARRARALHGAFAGLTRGRRVLDKYPEMLFRVPFLRALFPAATFVVVAREGWATARSVERWSAAHGHAAGPRRVDWWGRDDRKWHALVGELVPREPDLAPHAAELRALAGDRERAALEWTVSLRWAARLAPEPDVELVRLEELARAPAEGFARLLARCGLAPDERVHAYARRSAQPATPGEPFPLPAPLAAAFARTSAELGYGSPGTARL
jgi:sulfotransferase family protein